jgi:hypothetical protein
MERVLERHIVTVQESNCVLLVVAGLLISAVSDEEVGAVQFALGTVYPNLLLSGEFTVPLAEPVYCTA